MISENRIEYKFDINEIDELNELENNDSEDEFEILVSAKPDNENETETKTNISQIPKSNFDYYESDESEEEFEVVTKTPAIDKCVPMSHRITNFIKETKMLPVKQPNYGAKFGLCLDHPGNINGMSTVDFDIKTVTSQPWCLPGADINKYFNYGFNAENWSLYCKALKNFPMENIGDTFGHYKKVCDKHYLKHLLTNKNRNYSESPLKKRHNDYNGSQRNYDKYDRQLTKTYKNLYTNKRSKSKSLSKRNRNESRDKYVEKTDNHRNKYKDLQYKEKHGEDVKCSKLIDATENRRKHEKYEREYKQECKVQNNEVYKEKYKKEFKQERKYNYKNKENNEDWHEDSKSKNFEEDYKLNKYEKEKYNSYDHSKRIKYEQNLNSEFYKNRKLDQHESVEKKSEIRNRHRPVENTRNYDEMNYRSKEENRYNDKRNDQTKYEKNDRKRNYDEKTRKHRKDY